MSRHLTLGLVTLAVIGFCQLPAVAGKDEDDRQFQVAGKVTDEHKHPVKRAQVILLEKSTGGSQRTSTDGQGHFSVNHPPCEQLTLMVIPPLKSGLAQAVLTEVPGEEGRHVLISVRKGFLTRGRVVFGDQPLKNVGVKVHTHDGDVVHGGGYTSTDGKGRFEMVLTPGDKTIEITDVQNPQIVGSFRQKYKVTADGVIPDLKLPPSRSAEGKR